MGMKLLPLSCIFVGILAADDQTGLQIIRLNDNSIIRAQVSEVAGGFYMAKSPTLGDLKIPTGNVISIKNEEPIAQNGEDPPAKTTSHGASSTPDQGASIQTGIEAIRSTVSSKVQNLAATREGMAAIEQFSQNQEVKAILGDSAMLKAIQTGDYNALMKSPSVQKLMDNPQTKGLVQSVLNPSGPTAPKQMTNATQGVSQ
ncbi:MAG: hypothetical protein D4R65_03045 [Verrucomicrobiaceae bacterium]|nr:MAG: hypothetical protein D4R65_03045 [Verrucomicrobiaceae bacterium]